MGKRPIFLTLLQCLRRRRRSIACLSSIPYWAHSSPQTLKLVSYSQLWLWLCEVHSEGVARQKRRRFNPIPNPRARLFVEKKMETQTNNPNPNPNGNSITGSWPVWPTVDGSLGLSEDESVKYARRFYRFGFAMLPWLWAVNCFYFWPVLRHSRSFPRIRPCILSLSLSLRFQFFNVVDFLGLLIFVIGWIESLN